MKIVKLSNTDFKITMLSMFKEIKDKTESFIKILEAVRKNRKI